MLAMTNAFNLEHLNVCPVCSSEERNLLYDDLEDDNFNIAEGTWSLWQCNSCTTAYLDPRPDRETIGRAYDGYGLHQELVDEFPNNLSLKSLFFKSLRNGYINKIYNTKFKPSIPLGLLLAGLPEQSVRSGSWVYFMPRPNKPQPKLLDVGSGNGLYVRRMQEAGWDAQGLEPGESGVEAGRKAGLVVTQGTLETADFPDGFFDAITMGHSIEHLHDPVFGMQKVYKWLAPGGKLYVGTPNIASYLRPILGRFWFPLDPPRHLVLFSPQSIDLLLTKTGFKQIEFHPVVSEEAHIVLRVANAKMTSKGNLPKLDINLQENLAKKAVRKNVYASDSIALTAIKE